MKISVSNKTPEQLRKWLKLVFSHGTTHDEIICVFDKPDESMQNVIDEFSQEYSNYVGSPVKIKIILKEEDIIGKGNKMIYNWCNY